MVFVHKSPSMWNHISTAVTSQCHFHACPIGQAQILFSLRCNPCKNLAVISAATQKITHSNKSRYPHCTAICQHGNRFFAYIIPMLHAVCPSLNGCLNSVISICMAHHCKTLFMGDMNHFFYFFFIQRLTGNLPMIVKIQNPGSHNLNKVCSQSLGFHNLLMIFS